MLRRVGFLTGERGPVETGRTPSTCRSLKYGNRSEKLVFEVGIQYNYDDIR